MLLFAVSMALGAEPGEQIELSPTPGQPVLVNFWASWCAPCRAELPLLDALNDEVESEGLSVVAVNLDSQRRPAEGVMRHLGLDLPVIYGDDDLAEAFAVLEVGEDRIAAMSRARELVDRSRYWRNVQAALRGRSAPH